jgi:ribonuclease P protein component
MPASLKKNERLCSFSEIQSLMKKGETFFHYPFKVVYQNISIEEEGTQAPNAIMVSVPKRNFKRAVKRNLLKRRIRESYRLNKEILAAPQGCRTNILFVYVSKDIKEFSYIEEKVKEILALTTKGKTKGDKKDGAQQSESNS